MKITNKFGFSWIWIIIIVLAIIILGFGIYFWLKNISTNNYKSPATQPTASTTSLETWIKSDQVILNGVTSTCTLNLGNNYRMFYMKDGNIVYADSSDGINFLNPISTGTTEDENKMISNPAVLKINNDNWIMVYEQQPMKQPGWSQGPNSAKTQRNLYLATSNDGKKFTKSGLAIDSSKKDDYFASVPDLVLLPDGKIRLYYVSGGEAIGSALSSDNGKTWTREDGYRLENKAVDPDVIIKTEDNKTAWVMYYSVLTGGGNALYKSVSNDGLNWNEGILIISASSANKTIVDPDVLEINQNQYRMFFAEMGTEESSGNNPPETKLYSANYSGNIF